MLAILKLRLSITTKNRNTHVRMITLNKHWQFICLFFFLSSSALTSVVQAETPIRLVEAEAYLKQSFALQAQQEDVLSWQAQQDAAAHLNRPQLDITVAGIAYQKNIQLTLPVLQLPLDHTLNKHGLRSQLELTWPLYTGGKTQAIAKQSQARVSQAEAQYRMLQLELTQQLFQVYFLNHTLKHALQVREKAVQAAQAHQHKAIRFEEEGLITSLQRMQADVALAEANRQQLQAKQHYQDAQQALQSLLQQPHALDVTTPLPRPLELPHDLSWFQKEARTMSPLFAQIHSQQEQLEHQLAIETSALKPSIALLSSYDLNRSATPITEPDWSIGLGIRYAITAPMKRSSRVQAVRHKQDQLYYAKQQAELELQQGVAQVYRQAGFYYQHYTLLEHDLALAAEHARMQQQAFSEGLSTSLDVTDAQLKQTGTEILLLEAAYGYLVSLSVLTQLIGQPDYMTLWFPELNR